MCHHTRMSHGRRHDDGAEEHSWEEVGHDLLMAIQDFHSLDWDEGVSALFFTHLSQKVQRVKTMGLVKSYSVYLHMLMCWKRPGGCRPLTNQHLKTFKVNFLQQKWISGKEEAVA